tara:strand:- start:1013 stop:2782 length:1770 start_codon:yes stop_codon:yes gene_type:complete
MALYINRQAPQSGISSILAQRGRMGDTELVHMTKPEVKRLQQTGLLSLNPQTGLPEYFLGDVFKGIKSSFKNFLKPENLVPTIASIALPAFGGKFLQDMGLSQLASSSILGGLGAGIGNLPFKSLGDSATAGLLAGGTRYSMGKIGQMMGPSDPEVRRLSAGRGGLGEKEFMANQRDLAASQKDYLFDAGFGDEANLEEFGGDYGELLYGDIGALAEPRFAPLPMPGMPPIQEGANFISPTLRIEGRGLEPAPVMTDFYTRSPGATGLEPRLSGREEFGKLGKVSEFGDSAFTNQGFSPTDARYDKIATVTPDELAKEYSRVLEEQDAMLIDGSLTDDQKNMIARGYADANDKLLDRSAMRQASDPYRNTRNIVADKGGLNALVDEEFYESLPVSEILSSGASGLNATLDIGQQALLREEEEKFLAEQAKQGVPAPIARTKYKRLRSRASPLSTAQTLAAATKGGGLGGASGFYGPTQYAPVRTAEAGGLISLGHGGRPDFEGMVEGDGHGMEDNVIMDIKQKGGLLAVSPKEYVVPADVMSMLGNGNPDDGANEMDKFIGKFRQKKYGRPTQPPEMDGSTALQSLMKG